MATPTYTLFFGTFIHLPRQTSLNDPHTLEISHGVLWVSTDDGKIKGYNWDVRSEDDLREFLEGRKWGNEVKVVRTREERNEFFFPGFIGMSTLYPLVIDGRVLMRKYRHAHPRPAISEFRAVRVFDVTGLVAEVYLPA